MAAAVILIIFLLIRVLPPYVCGFAAIEDFSWFYYF